MGSARDDETQQLITLLDEIPFHSNLLCEEHISTCYGTCSQVAMVFAMI